MTRGVALAAFPGDLARLRRVLLLNFCNAVGGVVFLLIVRVWMIDSDWLVVLALMVAVVAAVGLGSLWLTSRGRVATAVVVVAAVTWALYLPLTAIAPISAWVSPITLVPPAAVAGAFVTPRVLRMLLAAMTVTAAIVIVEARLLPGTGLEALAADSPWIIHGLMLFFIPSSVAMVSLSAWFNHHSLWGRAEDLGRARHRLGQALTQERRALERDLHDGAQQLLIAASLQLKVACRLDGFDAALRAPLIAVGDTLSATVMKLRVLAHGVYPAVLTDSGISEALRTLPGCRVVTAKVSRYDPDVEAAVYFCCARVVQEREADAAVLVSVRDAPIRGVQVVIIGQGAEPSASVIEALEDRAAASGGSIAVSGTDCAEGWTLTGVFGANSTPTAPTLAVRPPVVHLAMQGWVGSAVLTLVLYLFAARNPWLLVIAFGAIAGLLVTAAASLALRANRPQEAAWLIVGPFAASAVLMTVLAPLTLYYTPSTLLIGVLLVIPTAPHRLVPRYVLGASALSLVLVVFGRFQNWTNLTEDLKGGWTTVVVVSVIPAAFLLLSLVMWFNYIELWERAIAAQRSTARLATAADEARRSLARELELGPLESLRDVQAELEGLAPNLKYGERAESAIADCRRLLAEAEEVLERIGAGLSPTRLVEHGLAAALTMLAALAPGRIYIKTDDVEDLSAEKATCLYFCCSEAVQNALKHSGETSVVTISLDSEPGTVRLEVRDDGCGFDPAGRATDAPARGGIANMLDRLTSLGGTLGVQSHPGSGTVVSASLPR